MKMYAQSIEVRESKIHGTGVFAIQKIRKGVRLIEYTGIRKRWSSFKHDNDAYVCLFDVGRGLVVDPRKNGSIARFINHSCRPNCEAVLEDGRVYIESIRAIAVGEEITYDYAVTLDRRPSKADIRKYACRCGSGNCRGTLLEAADPVSTSDH